MENAEFESASVPRAMEDAWPYFTEENLSLLQSCESGITLLENELNENFRDLVWVYAKWCLSVSGKLSGESQWIPDAIAGFDASVRNSALEVLRGEAWDESTSDDFSRFFRQAVAERSRRDEVMAYARHRNGFESPLSSSQERVTEERQRKLRVRAEIARAEADRARREARMKLKARFTRLHEKEKYDKANSRAAKGSNLVDFWAAKCRTQLETHELGVMAALLSRTSCVETILLIMANNPEGISGPHFQKIIFPAPGASGRGNWEKKCRSLVRTREDFKVVADALNNKMTIALLIHMINCGAPRGRFKEISAAIAK